MKFPAILWKSGVTQGGPIGRQFARQELEREGSWPFSYSLLEGINANYEDADEVLLTRLYASLEAGSGIYKITRQNRFPILDQFVNDVLPHHFSGSMTIHDAAASNGITTLDWHKRLSSGKFDFRLVASDYYDRIWLVTIGDWTTSLDQFGIPLQVANKKFVVSANRPENIRFPVNRMIQWYARRFVIPQAIRVFVERQRNSENSSPRKSTTWNDRHHQPSSAVDVHSSVKVRDVQLFHPLVLRKCNEDMRLCVAQHNLFEPLSEQCDVFRVMNFLTQNHLGVEQIRKGIGCLCQSVRIGGLLILGRTRDESDGALLCSIYQVCPGNRLKKLYVFDGPWEAEALIAESLVS